MYSLNWTVSAVHVLIGQWEDKESSYFNNLITLSQTVIKKQLVIQINIFVPKYKVRLGANLQHEARNGTVVNFWNSQKWLLGKNHRFIINNTCKQTLTLTNCYAFPI